MGSEYKILTDSNNMSVYIGEMSNRLELYAEHPVEGTVALTNPMSPAEMLKGFMEGIKAISYWMTKEEFDEIFDNLETYPF